jgi:hypothetical protein
MFFSRLETGGSAILTQDVASKVAAVLGVTDPSRLFEDSER